jgi:hypothetical protein
MPQIFAIAICLILAANFVWMAWTRPEDLKDFLKSNWSTEWQATDNYIKTIQFAGTPLLVFLLVALGIAIGMEFGKL